MTLLTVTAALRPAAAQEPPRFTIDMLLNAEDFGDAAFSPDGTRIAYEEVVARADLESTLIESDGLDDRRVLVADGSAERSREIAGDPGERFALAPYAPWSPDGKRLALTMVSDGEMRLAIWDTATGEVTRMRGRPPSFYPQHAWLADGRVAHLALPDGVPQRFAHGQILTRAAERWRGVWTGGSEVASVSSASATFDSTHEPAANLMIAFPDGRAVSVGAGDYQNFAIAPDRKRIAVIRLAEPSAVALDARGRRGALEIFKLTASGAARIHTFPALDVSKVAWSPTGDRLLVGAGSPSSTERGAQLYMIDAASGRTRRVQAPSLSFVDPSPYSGWAAGVLPIGWIDNKPAAIAATKTSARQGRAPSAGETSAYGDVEGVRLDLHIFENGTAKVLTEFASTNVTDFTTPPQFEGALVIADGALWRVQAAAPPERLSPRELPPVISLALDPRYPSPLAETAYHRAGSGEERIALTVLGEDGAPRRVTLRLGDRTTQQARDGERIVATSPDLTASLAETADGWFKRLVLSDTKGSRPLASINAELKSIAVGDIRPIRYNVGEQQLAGWVLMPPGAGPSARFPAVVWVYGGSVWNGPPGDSQPSTAPPAFNGQLLAAAGFAVIYPSTPLGPGADTDIPATLAAQAVAAIDAAAAAGLVDTKRVGVMGQSFGGYSVAAILAKRSDRFRAGIALAGAFDWMANFGVPGLEDILAGESDAANVSMTYIEEGQPGLKRPFWEDPQPYIRNSPIFHIEKLNTPLLLLHGDMDIGPTSFIGASRMYAALVRAGKKPTLVRYWGEGHMVRSKAGVRDQWDRILEWFNARLK